MDFASTYNLIRRPQFGMAAVLLLLIGAVPIVQIVWEVAQGNRPQFLELFDRLPSERQLREYEADLEDGSWVTQYVRPTVQQLRLVAVNALPAKLVAGRGGWLFYAPGVDYLIEPAPAAPLRHSGPADALRAIRSFHAQLVARGIQLLVVVVPGKATVYPDQLTRRVAAGRVVDSRTRSFVAQLRTAGVQTLDLAETFQQLRTAGGQGEHPLYLSRDTHWSGTGVRLAAAAIAERIQQLGWLEPLEDRQRVRYTTQRLQVVRRGDLTQMLAAARPTQTGTAQEVEVWQVKTRADGQPYRDSMQAPVLLLGDSFARIYQSDEPRAAGLAAHLAHQLGIPLTTLANDGGASTLVRQQLARKTELLAGKRLVIWEFVERDLRFGLEGWQEVRLGAVKSE